MLQNKAQSQDFSAYEDMELSTKLLIQNAKRRKIKVEILDREANFISLSQGKRVEYVMQATKTSLDSYMSFLCMEDKNISKLLLKRKGLRVPEGHCFSDLQEALGKGQSFLKKDIVVKPTTSNYGSGITILKAQSSLEEYKTALELAFSHAARVIVEEYVQGEEYRFLIMKDRCSAVCKRIPSNVLGDGYRTIRELVEKKNEDPRRGRGGESAHTTPMERIQFGPIEKETLAKQGLDWESIPEKGKRVFLRFNSNVSTGGEAIDCADDIPVFYKEIALQAAKSVGACICGVDMIISGSESHPPSKESYVILELNFNPTIYIHEYPAEGKERKVSNEVLDLLGFD